MNEQKNIPKIRTRIAPSPTGYAHIGTIYQALFNYAYAKKQQGSFIVRIEDTDRTRIVEDAEKFIFDSLDWVNLREDESPRKDGKYAPYRQSERLELYHRYAEQLVTEGHAYFSYFPKRDAGQKKDYTHGKSDSTAETSEKAPTTIKEMMDRGDWVIRMKVPQDETITVRDELRGDISFPSSEVTEQVLIKSDGFPTYHLAVVVDDHLMAISHIVRAEEWLSSLPKHVLLFRYFNWEMPPVYHTATLRNPDKSKLSKRHGHTNILWYKEEGYLPEALLNYLALLGWSHPEEKEIFSLNEFMQLFDLKDIRPVAAVFDLTKLTWMNGEYIRLKTNEELAQRLGEFYKADEPITKLLKNNPKADEIIALAKTRIKTLKEFKNLVRFLFELPDPSSLHEEHVAIIPQLKEALESIPKEAWNQDTIFAHLKTIMEETGSVRMPVFYVIFTGSKQGLPLPHALEILGREETLERLGKLVK